MNQLKDKNACWIPWMRRALQLASLAEGNVSPNPLVGAVVINKEGVLVGEGFHSQAGKAHAEINALSQAREKAKDGILIITLEPCCHYGRTPPCTEAIISAGISKVIVALKDPDSRVSGKGLLRLKDAGIEVIYGVLEKEAAYQNRDFIFRVTNGRSLGVLKWAMSLDGRIALPNGASKWISSSESRNWVHKLRSQCDAVIVGGQTIRTDNPLLTSRGLSDPEPFRVVLSKSCDFSRDSIIWNTELAKTFLAYGPDSEDIARKLNLPKGVEKLPLDTSSPTALLETLAKKGCNRVLWECGSSLATEALKEGCVQELAVIIAPRLLGGDSSNTPLGNFGFASIDEAFLLGKMIPQSIDKDLLIRIPFSSNKF